MTREVIRVEPLSTYLENWKAPTSAVTRHGDTLYVSGFPPFDPSNLVEPTERRYKDVSAGPQRRQEPKRRGRSHASNSLRPREHRDV